MWRLALACVVVLAFAGVNGAVVDNEDFHDDNVPSNLDFTSILLNILKPKDSIDADDLQLEDKIAVLDTFLGRNTVANTIRQLLESFRPIVINGNDSIPPLDPLLVDELGPFVYTHTGLRLTTTLRNFRMEGLRWYVVNDVTFNALRLTVGVRLTQPWIVLTGRYDTSTWIGLISHRSAGNYRVLVNRIDVNADARIGTSLVGGHLVLRDLNIKLNVQDVQIQLTGMTGSSILNRILNSLVQSITRDFINNEMENVSQRVTDELFDVFNKLLKDFTLEDLLGRSF